MRENLIIVRSGPNSRHPQWLEGDPDRSWDLLLCPYKSIPLKDALALGDIGISRVQPGLKWTGIRALFADWPFKKYDWHDYNYIVIADDDLQVAPGTWTRFFKLCEDNYAALAAPALTIGSVASHPITVQQAPTGARRTTFVEVMTPCFRTDVWEGMLPTLAETPSGIGWGVDYVWAKLLGYKDIFVMDETPVTHSRPGNNTDEICKLGFAEMEAMLKKFQAPQLERNL